MGSHVDDAIGVHGQNEGLGDELGGGEGTGERYASIGAVHVDVEGGEVAIEDVFGFDHRDDAGVGDLVAGDRSFFTDDFAALLQLLFELLGRKVPLLRFGRQSVFDLRSGV